MIILSVLLILLSIFVCLYVKLQFRQIGPSCGYFALTQTLLNSSPPWVRYRCVSKVITSDLVCKKTIVGEIFTTERLIETAENICRQAKSIIPECSFITVADLKKRGVKNVLKEYYMIVPYQGVRYPHYCIIKKAEDGKLHAWESGNGCFRITEEELVKKNRGLCKTFYWNDYFKNSMPPDKKIKNYIRNRELTKIISKAYRDSQKTGNDRISPCDLRNKIILIKKETLKNGNKI